MCQQTYTGKSWVQLPVGPTFFIPYYELKNVFYINEAAAVVFVIIQQAEHEELYLRAMTLVPPKLPTPPLQFPMLAHRSFTLINRLTLSY